MLLQKTCVLALVVMGTLAARAQPAPATATAPANPAGVTIVDPDGIARVYPTNMTTIVTAKAGILHLCAADIPRYTQTGPLPNPAPARPSVIPPVPHDPKLPTIWTIGDSTVRTGYNGTGDDQKGQWGWGAPFVGYFDPQKVNVVNRAVGGTTSASFYNDQWKAMVGLLKKGDVLILQFGTNSGGAELRGIGDETQQAAGRGGQPSTSHTFGWFLRQFIAETRAKGATPVVCSLIPRNGRGPDGKTVRSATSQAGWARDVAAAEKADFIDLNELVARKYDAMDKAAVDALFVGSPHTSWTGAVVNAETVISGLKALKNDPVAAYYVPQVKDIAPAPELSQPATSATAPANPAAATARRAVALVIGGREDPRAPGYIVVFEDNVDAPAELARLEKLHGFQRKNVYNMPGFKGFAAVMPAEAAEKLRWEPSIKSIEHDGVAGINGGGMGAN
jgi:lysophospholipase L1-like esterase